jgi:hypothetical protein
MRSWRPLTISKTLICADEKTRLLNEWKLRLLLVKPRLLLLDVKLRLYGD